MKTIRLLSVLSCCLLVACGCSKRPTDTGEPAASAPAASEAGDDQVTIAFIPKNTGNPYFNSLVEGFEDACAELGCEFYQNAPATAEATSQVPIIKEQIQRGVDVIAISPNSPDALNNIFDEARAQGIIVLVVNSDIPGSEAHRDAAVMPMDFDETGPSQIELLGSMIDYQGQIAILSSTTDAPDQNYWIEGMKETLQEEKYQNMELVAVVYGDDDPQKSLTECEALLSRFPDLRGIIAPTTVAVAAAAQCVESTGVYPGGPNAKNGGIVVTGLGTPNQMRRFVESDVVEKFALWSPRDEGYLAAYLANGLVEGTIELGKGNTFEVPELGERQFQENNVVITGPPVVFTKENIDAHHF